jgi:uncharacterized LabA/DUF88 family protein
VSAYIDGANLFHSGESIGVRIDFLKLKSIIKANRLLVDLNYYNSTRGSPAETSFFNAIERLGYNVKLIKLHQYGSSVPQEKRIDTQIVADALVDGLVDDKFDIAVFCSGDKDILPAVEHLLQKKKKVEIMSFWHTLAWDLKICGAKIINLTTIAQKISLK